MVRTRLVLVRHGESRSTVDRVIGGAIGCQGLTDLGRRQAEALARRLATTGEVADLTALLSSTLPRALETAAVLAPAVGGMAVQADPELCELRPGESDGSSWEQFSERFGSFDAGDEPYRPMSPGGESWAEFMLRVGRALTRVATEHEGGTVLIACHGGIVEGSLCNFLPLPWPGATRALALCVNTSLTEWHCYSGERRRLRWELARYNDAAHLGPTERPEPPG